MVYTDTSNQPFVEFAGPADDSIRITSLPATGYRTEQHFRICIRQADGRLRQGPGNPGIADRADGAKPS